MKQLNQFILEKLKLNKNIETKPNTLETVEDFALKYDLDIDKKDSIYTLSLSNDLETLINKLIKLSHDQWIDLYFLMQSHVNLLYMNYNIDSKYHSAIKRNLPIISIYSEDIYDKTTLGTINIHTKPKINITITFDYNNKDQKKCEKLLVNLFDFLITNEEIREIYK